MSVTDQTRPATAQPRHVQMLIDGARVDSASGATLTVENPARRTPIASIPRGGKDDVDRAVLAAQKAFPAWSKVPPRQRGRMLLRIAEAMEARIEEMARIIAEETGNALRTQARSEATLSADIFRYFGGLAGELKGGTIPLGEHVLSYTRREPLGVVGAIIPWNAPVLLGALKIAPALCAGNTLVLKAAEDAPLGVLLMAEICQEFLPPGVLNVLTGLGAECGAPLAENPIIRKLSFTGSTEVGKLIMRAAAERIVPVSLELGGKSPSIVYPDADEDWVVDGVIAGMRFTRQSQSCTAGSRLFLHQDIFDSFLDKLTAKTQALKLGDPLDEASDIGCIINEKQFRKVCGYVDEGLKRKDARLVFGGLPPESGPLSQGYFAIPTVFADTSNDWRLVKQVLRTSVNMSALARPNRSAKMTLRLLAVPGTEMGGQPTCLLPGLNR
jgi:betaine-aldehyde dehydrogenase